MLRGALAHGLGGRRAPGGGGQRGVAARSTDQGLRCAVGRLDQAHLALQASQRQHAVLLERAGELLGGDAVDLVPAVGHEVEDEAHLADLLGEPAHLVVAHAGGVPVERGGEVVGQHLVGVDGVDRVGELLGRRRDPRSSSPSRGCRRTAPRQAIWRSHTGCRRGSGSNPPASSPARSPTPTSAPSSLAFSRAAYSGAVRSELAPLRGAHLGGSPSRSRKSSRSATASP